MRGRFAPSPSGQMHLGNAWTALLAWLASRSQGGSMVLRLEDLDPGRSRSEYAAGIMEDLQWLGLDWDEGPDREGPNGPYRQSERRQLYQEAVERLGQQGLVYECYCSRAELHVAEAPHAGESEWVYPGTCRCFSREQRQKKLRSGRRPALRLAVPDQTLTFTDGLYGEVRQHLPSACGDFVIRRSDGVHAYQLAVVVDDGLMRINQVVRGQDLLTSTPRQLLLYRLLGMQPPAFTHVPLLIAPDGHRLSKRQQSLSLAALKQTGVRAERIIGYLAWKAGLLEQDQSAAAADLVHRFSLDLIPRQAVVVHDTEILGER
ncbi:tRNA glutamyl-Q(34) synthetase GluQRS [Acetonema longum]|uniref:Glutamyl-Q tRNA(Asp) synthetase n=1 Tax=Acetonema longum DSM 6540 TaxID=1009370 RepID=F7NI20_9FIRM|nr:tRNA glutamyl-Q(34) synthetase GluQRS [Acetonema longum]EGO64327.1 Glutamate--tRNA ligase [Acetonema longum DSM 6540]